MGLFTKKISFDFGSSSTRIVRDGECSLIEKTLIEVDNNGKLIAFGNSVNENTDTTIISPITAGNISDFISFETLIRKLISKSFNHKNKQFITPSLKALCLVPDYSNEVELRAYRDALENAGAKEVYMIYSSKATAIGIGIDQKDTYLLIDAGAGKISISVSANETILCTNELKFGTLKLKEVLKSQILKNYNIACSNQQIKDILHDYLSFQNTPKKEVISIDSKELDLNNINQIITPYFQLILHEIQCTLDSFKTKSNNTIQYFIITGGLSKLNGFEKGLKQVFNYTIIDKSDDDYTLKGLIKIDSNFETLKKTIK